MKTLVHTHFVSYTRINGNSIHTFKYTYGYAFMHFSIMHKDCDEVPYQHVCIYFSTDMSKCSYTFTVYKAHVEFSNFKEGSNLGQAFPQQGSYAAANVYVIPVLPSLPPAQTSTPSLSLSLACFRTWLSHDHNGGHGLVLGFRSGTQAFRWLQWCGLGHIESASVRCPALL